MILQVKTEKELIEMVESLKKEVQQLRLQNNPDKNLSLMVGALQKEVQQLRSQNNTEPKTINNNDVLELINKHVTIDFVNRLYKKGR